MAVSGLLYLSSQASELRVLMRVVSSFVVCKTFSKLSIFVLLAKEAPSPKPQAPRPKRNIQKYFFISIYTFTPITNISSSCSPLPFQSSMVLFNCSFCSSILISQISKSNCLKRLLINFFPLGPPNWSW